MHLFILLFTNLPIPFKAAAWKSFSLMFKCPEVLYTFIFLILYYYYCCDIVQCIYIYIYIYIYMCVCVCVCVCVWSLISLLLCYSHKDFEGNSTITVGPLIVGKVHLRQTSPKLAAECRSSSHITGFKFSLFYSHLVLQVFFKYRHCQEDLVSLWRSVGNFHYQQAVVDRWLVYGISTLVGLFYAKVTLTIMISNDIQYKNVSCQPLLGYFMPKSV